MTPILSTDHGKVYKGDCRDVLKQFPNNYFTGVLTDPPYGLEFMGKKWDKLDTRQPGDPNYKTNDTPGGRSKVRFSSAASYGGSVGKLIEEWHYSWAKEAFRVCKPGGFMLAFGGSRTHHRLMSGIEDAGWEIRDTFQWWYATGFPKSLDIARAIDKVERGVPQGRPDPTSPNHGRYKPGSSGAGPGSYMAEKGENNDRELVEAAKKWTGYGTAVKPAYEPIVVAMKPVDGTFVNNALTHGLAGINIDASRIPTSEPGGRPKREVHEQREDVEYDGSSLEGRVDGSLQSSKAVGTTDNGRWPTNVILSHSPECDDRCVPGCPVRELNEQSGDTFSTRSDGNPNEPVYRKVPDQPMSWGGIRKTHDFRDTGGASRFFYIAKVSKSERDGSKHPTIKPIALMEYLAKMLAPPENAMFLDLFLGSGTTGIACEKLGYDWVGIDLDCSEAIPRLKKRTQQRGLW